MKPINFTLQLDCRDDPYTIQNNISIINGGTLIIEAGVVLNILPNVVIEVKNGTFISGGNSTHRVSFNATNEWNGFSVMASNITFNYTSMKGAYNYFKVASSVLIVENSEFYEIQATDSSLSIISSTILNSNVTFFDVSYSDIIISSTDFNTESDLCFSFVRMSINNSNFNNEDNLIIIQGEFEVNITNTVIKSYITTNQLSRDPSKSTYQYENSILNIHRITFSYSKSPFSFNLLANKKLNVSFNEVFYMSQSFIVSIGNTTLSIENCIIELDGDDKSIELNTDISSNFETYISIRQTHFNNSRLVLNASNSKLLPRLLPKVLVSRFRSLARSFTCSYNSRRERAKGPIFGLNIPWLLPQS